MNVICGASYMCIANHIDAYDNSTVKHLYLYYFLRI